MSVMLIFCGGGGGGSVMGIFFIPGGRRILGAERIISMTKQPLRPVHQRVHSHVCVDACVVYVFRGC